MKNEKLIAAFAACLTLVLILLWAFKGPAQNLGWAIILMIFFGPFAVAGYVVTFHLVAALSRKLKMDGFLFCLLASAALGSLIFALPTGFGFFTAFSRGKFDPRLLQWGMELALMVVGATGGAVGGITYYLTKQSFASKSKPPGQSQPTNSR